MNSENSQNLNLSISSHTFIAKFIHWSFTLLYAYGILKQVNNISQLEDYNLLIIEILFAIVFLIIVLIRYFYMIRYPTLIGAPENISKVHRLIARLIHIGIYFSLIMLPVSGLMIAFLFLIGQKEGLFQTIALRLYEFSVTLSYILIGIHILAAVYSRLKGEMIWHAMVPFWNETNTVNRIPQFLMKLETYTINKIQSIFKIDQNN